ncbi:MFS transporter [Streptomyces sp. BI20]|uniref:MFS transporter n=1 Tax=Streptomyces sp. BI20 TaxID=3403460 RepID=UPI003C763E8C
MTRPSATDPAEPPEVDTAAASRHRLAVPVLAFCGVVVALMQTLVVPLLPHIPELTGSTPGAAGWLVTVTLLTGAVFTPVLGRVGDLFGKRRVLMLSLVVLTAGSVLCAVTSHIGVLITGRALQGAALAVIPLGISIIRDEVPAERVLSSIALMSSTLGIGAAVGLPVAALVVQHFDWHTMFWASAGLGLLDLVLVARCVPAGTVRAGGRLDLLGGLGLALTLVGLLLSITQGPVWGWGSARTLGLLVGSLVLGLLWGRYELRTDAPMVDLRVSARPAVLLANLAALLIGFAFYANSLVTAQLVQEPTWTGYGLGASLVVSGLCMLPGGVAMVALSPVSARISARFGPRATLGLAAAVMAVGYGVRFFTSHSLGMIVAGATVVAAGTALAYSALPALVMSAVPVTETGAANGLNTLMRSVGQAACSTVVVVVLSRVTFTSGGRTAPTLGAYLTVFVCAGVAAVGALVIAAFLPAGRGGVGRPRAKGGTVAVPSSVVAVRESS